MTMLKQLDTNITTQYVDLEREIKHTIIYKIGTRYV